MHRLCFTQLLPVVLGELLCCCYLHVALMGVYIYIYMGVCTTACAACSKCVQQGWTALLLGSVMGHAEEVKQLLDRGADVNARDAVSGGGYIAFTGTGGGVGHRG